MRLKALFATVAAAVVAAAPLAALAQQKTITFRFNDPEAPQLRAALDEFEQRNPGIKVTMQRVSWGDAQQQYLREAAVGTAPDVAQLAFVWPRSFGGAGALRPLDDLITRPGLGVKGWDDFFARDLAVGRRRQGVRRAVDDRHLRAHLQQGHVRGRRRGRLPEDLGRAARRRASRSTRRPARPAGDSRPAAAARRRCGSC